MTFRVLLLIMAGFAASKTAAGQSECDNRMVPGQAACLDSIRREADAVLSAVFIRALAAIPDSAHRARLRASETAWMAYRASQERLLQGIDSGAAGKVRLKRTGITMTTDRADFLRNSVLHEGPPSPAESSPGQTLDEQVLLNSMKTDLRNLIDAEESFFADSLRYSTRIGPGGVLFTPSVWDTLAAFRATATGWTATVRSRYGPRECWVFVGRIGRHPPAAEGVPVCP